MEKFHSLSANRLLFDPDYLALLSKVRDLLHKGYGDQDTNTVTIDTMISSTRS